MNHSKSRLAAVVVTVAAIIGVSNISATAADQTDAAAEAALPANSVTSSTVVNGSLYQQDINPAVVGVLRTPKQASVTGWSIKDGTVGLADLYPPVRTQVTRGRLTEPITVRMAWQWDGDEGAALQRSEARCPAGKIAIIGGYLRDGGNLAGQKGLQIITSTPYVFVTGPTQNGWLVEGFNNSTEIINVETWVWCVRLTT
jgi:hypothetical protein